MDPAPKPCQDIIPRDPTQRSCAQIPHRDPSNSSCGGLERFPAKPSCTGCSLQILIRYHLSWILCASLAKKPYPRRKPAKILQRSSHGYFVLVSPREDSIKRSGADPHKDSARKKTCQEKLPRNPAQRSCAQFLPRDPFKRS